MTSCGCTYEYAELLPNVCHFVAPSKNAGCGVLDANCKNPGQVTKYATFLACEFNNDIVQLTNEEDAQSPMQIPIVASAAAVVGALNGKLPGWTGVTGVITGGLYAINIAGNSNIACTNSVYGH